jgi:hypothetical protein
VPPLTTDEINTPRKDRNPAFQYCEARYWMAYVDGKAAGRIAGIINYSYIEKWGLKYARFGWIDFIENFDVCQALLETVEKWAEEKGMAGVHGPLGFCDMDREGLLIDGFNKMSTIITIYNYPYYQEFLEKCGYKKDADWVEFEINVPAQVPARLQKIADMALSNSGLKMVHVKKTKEILPYADGVFELLNEAYGKLYGVVFLTGEQIKKYIKQYFSFLVPDYIKILVDKNGKVAAFGISMPSLSIAFKKSGGRLFPFGFIHILQALKKNDRLDLCLIAVRQDFKNKAVPAIIITEIHKVLIEKGVIVTDTAPMLEHNKKVLTIWKYYDKEVHKRRRCYLKLLEQ